MVDRQCGRPLHNARHAGQRNLPSGAGGHIQVGQRLRPQFVFGCHFQHHAVLVGLREDGGDEPLPEGVVQHAVNTGHGHTQAACRFAVNFHIGLQAFVLQVGGHIHQLWRGAQALQQLVVGLHQFVAVGAGQQKLVLRFGDAVFNAQVLHRLQVQVDTRHPARRFGDALHHLGDAARGRVALFQRFEVDQYPPGVERGIGTVHTNEARQALHRRVLKDNRCQCLLPVGHGFKRGGLGGLGNALDGTGVLQREKALGYHKIQAHGERQGACKDQQGGRMPLQHPGQHAPIGGDAGFKKATGLPVQPTVAFLRRVLEQAGAQHGRERERHYRRNQDGHRQRDGKFMEQAPYHIAHEQKRNQHGDERNGERDDGEADLFGPFQSGLQRWFALLYKTGDVLDHHNGVVHHKTGGDGQGHQREVIDGETRQVHDAKGTHDGQGHGKTGDQRGRGAAQKHKNHGHHQGNGKQQFDLHVAHRSADGNGAVGQHLHVDGGGQGGL